MRSQFKGYFSESQENIDQIWKEALIVLDANVLLNLYRYSDVSSAQFLKLIEDNAQRFWLPEQAVLEFLRNRHGVIHDQEKAYKDTSKHLSEVADKLTEEFSDNRGHPFVSKAALKKLTTAVEQIQKELEKGCSFFCDRFHKDDITERLVELFDGRVGEPYSEAELSGIFESGLKRYEEKHHPDMKILIK